MMMPIVRILLGIVLLFFGRTLYWVFVAAVGFLAGVYLANHWLSDQTEAVRILVAIGAGVLGAILGMLVQRLAFAIGGFFAGGYLALRIEEHFQVGGDPNLWMIIGGVVGAIIAAMVMDWAIIVLSSLAGAAAITSGVLEQFQQIDRGLAGIIFLVLAVVGIIVQGRRMGGLRSPPPNTA
jgi:hypothetical protein